MATKFTPQEPMSAKQFSQKIAKNITALQNEKFVDSSKRASVAAQANPQADPLTNAKKGEIKKCLC